MDINSMQVLSDPLFNLKIAKLSGSIDASLGLAASIITEEVKRGMLTSKKPDELAAKLDDLTTAFQKVADEKNSQVVRMLEAEIARTPGTDSPGFKH